MLQMNLGLVQFFATGCEGRTRTFFSSFSTTTLTTATTTPTTTLTTTITTTIATTMATIGDLLGRPQEPDGIWSLGDTVKPNNRTFVRRSWNEYESFQGQFFRFIRAALCRNTKNNTWLGANGNSAVFPNIETTRKDCLASLLLPKDSRVAVATSP